MFEKILQWDKDTFIYLNSLGLEQYDQFWVIATNFYTWTPLFLFFIFLFFQRFSKKKAFTMIAVLLSMIIFVTILTHLTKEGVARLRPNNNEDINTLIRIVKSPTTYSFFSGHAASSFSITTLVCLFLRHRFKWAWVFYAWPLVFSISRIYVGVHYPIDILIGALVGISASFLTYLLYTKLIVPYLRLDHP